MARSEGSVPFSKLNFTGGEIGKEVAVRSDLEVFRKSVESSLNMIPQPFGGIRRRPGSGFIDFTHPILASDGAEWIIPFRYSDTQSYLISFYDGFMRFYLDAALILDSSYSPNVITNVVAPGGDTDIDITIAGLHGFSVGDLRIINGSAMTELNGREFDVIYIGGPLDTFRIQDASISGRSTGAGGSITKAYSIVHPYAVADLPFIRYSQTGDTIVLTHPSYPTKKLTRGADHDEWTLTDVAFESNQLRPNLVDLDITTSASVGGFELQYALTRVGYDGSESLPLYSGWANGDVSGRTLGELGAPSFISISLETMVRPQGSAVGDTLEEVSLTWSDASSGTITVGDPAFYGVTTPNEFDFNDVFIEFTVDGNMSDIAAEEVSGLIISLGLGDGLPRETYPFTVASPLSTTPGISGSVYITLVSSGLDPEIFYRDVASWRLYRRGSPTDPTQITVDTRDSELWGLLAEISAVLARADNNITVRNQSYVYTDYAQQSVDYIKSPPAHRAILDRLDEYAKAAEFHEQRLIMGGTENDPRIVHASKSSAPFDFNIGHFVEADGALSFPIIGRTGQSIQHLLSVKELIILTDGGEWIANTPGQPLLPDTLAPKEHSTWGSSHVRPVVVGNAILFVQYGGHKVREMKYQLQSDMFVSDEVSILARHLFKTNPIIAMTYVEEPLGILWALLEDGTLASMTYVQEQGMWAWSHHDFGGIVKSIASIREEDDTDFLYLLIDRVIDERVNTYLERLEPSINTSDNWETANSLDCSSVYDPAWTPNDYLRLVQDNGDGTWDITLAAGHNFSATDYFYLYGAITMGLPDGLYRLGALVSGNRYNLDPVQWGNSDKYNPIDSFQISPAATMMPTVTSLTGLFHLIGESVTVWGSTGIEQTKTVNKSSGAITGFFIPVGRASVGLVSPWELRMLRIDAAEGIVRGATKRTTKVIGNFINSQRPDVADGDTDSIQWADWPKAGDNVDVLYWVDTFQDGVIKTTLPSSYDEDSGQIILSGSGAGPVYLLSLIPEALLGD